MIESCKYCHGNNIEFKSEFELYNPETDIIELKEGYLCNDCRCFHDVNDTFFQIEIDTEPKYKTKFLIE